MRLNKVMNLKEVSIAALCVFHLTQISGVSVVLCVCGVVCLWCCVSVVLCVYGVLCLWCCVSVVLCVCGVVRLWCCVSLCVSLIHLSAAHGVLSCPVWFGPKFPRYQLFPFPGKVGWENFYNCSKIILEQ